MAIIDTYAPPVEGSLGEPAELEPTGLEPPDGSPPPLGTTGPPTDPHRGRPRRPRRRLRILAIALLAVLVPTSWSYVGYLRAPGGDPVEVRTVNWLSDHGFESVVTDVEQWWYTHNTPSGTKAPAADIVELHGSAPVLITGRGPMPESIPTVISPPQPQEGVWSPVMGLAATGVELTFIRPDPAYPSVAVDLVRFDQRHTRLIYAPGITDPGGGPWAWSSEIPPAERTRTIAAFNAGFKFKDTAGGVYTEGRLPVRPLQDGLASVVITRDGTANVAQWGRDATMGPSVVSVRQSLALIVDGGRPVDGLSRDAAGRWGTHKSQLQYTSRSGLGIDSKGRLIYAAGADMSLSQLASALSDAGAVRGMQLDMHNPVVSFSFYRPDPGSTDGVSASKLYPAMHRDATRYLSPDQRDFLAVQAR